MCEKTSTPSNWAFTQYISKSVSTQSNISIFVNITTRFSSCNPSCPKSLNIFYSIVNSPVALLNTSNFSLLSTITGTTTAAFETFISFDIKPDEAGLYIALQDRGSCTNLNRVKVYYYQCPAQQVGLALYPSTPASTKQNVPVLVAASCATGSVNLSSPYVQCDNSGAWNGIINCSCNVLNGYKLVGDSCTGTMHTIHLKATVHICTFLIRMWCWTVAGCKQSVMLSLPRKLFTGFSGDANMPLCSWIFQS